MQFWMFQVNSAHIRYNAILVSKALDVFRLANIFFSFCRWTQLCSPLQHVYLYFPLEVVAPKNLSEKYALNSKYIIIRQIWAHKNAKQLNRTSKKSINQASRKCLFFLGGQQGVTPCFCFVPLFSYCGGLNYVIYFRRTKWPLWTSLTSPNC